MHGPEWNGNLKRIFRKWSRTQGEERKGTLAKWVIFPLYPGDLVLQKARKKSSMLSGQGQLLLSQQHKHRSIFLEFCLKDLWRLNIPRMGSSKHHAGCCVTNVASWWMRPQSDSRISKPNESKMLRLQECLWRPGQQLDRTDSSPNTYFIAPCGSWK